MILITFVKSAVIRAGSNRWEQPTERPNTCNQLATEALSHALFGAGTAVRTEYTHIHENEMIFVPRRLDANVWGSHLQARHLFRRIGNFNKIKFSCAWSHSIPWLELRWAMKGQTHSIQTLTWTITTFGRSISNFSVRPAWVSRCSRS